MYMYVVPYTRRSTLCIIGMYVYSVCMQSSFVAVKNKVSIPTPVNLVKYLEDANFEHQDFTLSSAVTLRARVSECKNKKK